MRTEYGFWKGIVEIDGDFANVSDCVLRCVFVCLVTVYLCVIPRIVRVIYLCMVCWLHVADMCNHVCVLMGSLRARQRRSGLTNGVLP